MNRSRSMRRRAARYDALRGTMEMAVPTGERRPYRVIGALVLASLVVISLAALAAGRIAVLLWITFLIALLVICGPVMHTAADVGHALMGDDTADVAAREEWRGTVPTHATYASDEEEAYEEDVSQHC